MSVIRQSSVTGVPSESSGRKTGRVNPGPSMTGA